MQEPTRSTMPMPMPIAGSPVRATRIRAARMALLIAGVLLATAGCSVQPWVMPYERDRIADPIMSFERDPISDAFTNHVYEVRESARGATGSSGGGCGCN